jgi:hypothetical protein
MKKSVIIAFFCLSLIGCDLSQSPQVRFVVYNEINTPIYRITISETFGSHNTLLGIDSFNISKGESIELDINIDNSTDYFIITLYGRNIYYESATNKYGDALTSSILFLYNQSDHSLYKNWSVTLYRNERNYNQIRVIHL